MKLAFFLCSRNWKSNRLRLLCSIAGIGLGTALVVAALTIDENAVRFKRAKELKKYGEPDLELPTSMPEWPGLQAELAAAPEVARVTAVVLNATEWRGPAGETHRVTLVRMPLADVEPFRALKLHQGSAFTDVSAATAAWVSLRLARSASLELGARLTVEGQEKIIAGFLNASQLAFHSDVILTGMQGSSVEADANVLAWVLLRQPERREAILARWVGQGWFARLPPNRQIAESPEDVAMRSGLRICALMSLALGLFTVLHTLLMAVRERRREIALLHALGATHRQIGGTLFLDALQQAVLGTGAGVFLGIFLAFLFGKIGISSMGAGRYSITGIPWFEISGVALVSVLLTLSGALVPVVSAGRVPTARVLVPMGLEHGAKEHSRVRWLLPVALLAALLLIRAMMAWLVDPRADRLIQFAWNFTALLALAMSLVFLSPSVIRVTARATGGLLRRLRGPSYYLPYQNVAQDGHKNATAVGALMLVFASLYCMHSLTDSLKNETRTWARQAVADRVFVRHRPADTDSERLRLAAREEVQAIVAIRNQVRLPLLIRGVELRKSGLTLSQAETKAWRGLEAQQGVIITHAVAGRTGLREGDELECKTRSEMARFRVLLVSDRFGYVRPDRAYVLMSPELLQKSFGAPVGSAHWTILHRARDVSSKQLAATARSLIAPKSRVVDAGSLISNRIRNVDVDFLIFDVILIGAVILAGLSLTNSLLIRALERRREVALYRALGMTRSELIQVLVAEGVVLGCIGACFALILGIPASRLGYEVLCEVSGLNLSYQMPIRWMVLCVVLCIVVSRLASRPPARFLAKEDVAGSLRYC